nr:ATP synthase-coupling factor 6, mitochondrial [Megalopta genalis]XP_033325676.1 ATP synthase-coupling factor 6, mitochondrial [Megalopta genalis]
MLTKRLTTGVPKIFKRNIGIVAPAWKQASDPIQQLFLDKVREYKQKSAGGKLVDPTPETEKEAKTELERLAKQFGSMDRRAMAEFPKISFKEPKIEP